MVYTYTFFNTVDKAFECAERKTPLTIPQRIEYKSKGLNAPTFKGTQKCNTVGYKKRVWGNGLVAGGFAVFKK
jgi:hypothetical protein